MIGDDGGYNEADYFPYTFALSLLIVTINVVVLCKYLSQNVPLWTIIKGHCEICQELLLSAFAHCFC